MRPIALTLTAILCASGVSAQDGQIRGDPPLAYWTAGRGPLTIVVLHGGPGIAHDYLRPEWDRLAPLGRLILYDQRGCGSSGRADSYTWRDHVRDLDRLITQLAPGRKVVLAGSSWGALLALHFGALYPDRLQALILSGTPPWPRRREHLTAPRLLVRIDSTRAPGRSDSTGSGPGLLAAGGDTAFARRFKHVCRNVHEHTLRSLGELPPESLRQLHVPTLLVRGTGGHIPDASEQIADALPNAWIVTIPGAGHDPWYEQPQVFFAEAKRFLSDVLARQR